MINFLFTLLMIAIFGKLLWFAIKATWSITKILFSIVFLPLVLIILVINGLLALAFPILIVVGIISLFVHD